MASATGRYWTHKPIGYILLLPVIIVNILFIYYPSLEAFRLSFYRTFRLGQKTEFAGLANYISIVETARFQKSFFVSFLFAVVVVVGSVSIGLAIGYAIHNISFGKDGYLLAAVWPYAMPTAVAAAILNFLFNPIVGVFFHYLNTWFGIQLQWFGDPVAAFAVVSITTIWKQLGYNVIFIIAALSSVPKSIEESSRLDGVGDLKLLYRVYIPLISPTLFFLVIINTVSSYFGSFAIVELMTAGGPNGWTNLLIYAMVEAFRSQNIGLASAASTILFMIVAVLMYVQVRYSDRFVYY